MNWRELIFLASFVVIPIPFWFWRMDPLLDRHSEALQAQIQARMADTAARKFIHERDQILVDWSEFWPIAELELQNITMQLNPIVLQNRVLDVAWRLDCDMRIEDRTKPDGPVTFRITGSGRPLQVFDLLRHLERGQHRARFSEFNLTYSELGTGEGYEANFHGAFTIPSIPHWDESKVAELLRQEQSDRNTSSEVNSEEVSS